MTRAIDPRRASPFDGGSGPVTPDGVTIRRRRRRHGWSRRDFVEVIADASRRATGVPERIAPNLLRGIEEENEPVPYAVVCLIAAGLDCSPVELVGEDEEPESGSQDS